MKMRCFLNLRDAPEPLFYDRETVLIVRELFLLLNVYPLLQDKLSSLDEIEAKLIYTFHQSF